MALACEVSPISAFLSTNLNNKIETYSQLGDRIKRSLGWPLISIEVHQDQLFENIQIAVEYFTKYAGYTKEFLVFDSNLYEANRGIRLDNLFTIANSEYTTANKLADVPVNPGANFDVEYANRVFVSLSAIPSTTFTASSALSGTFSDGIDELEIIDQTIYDSIIAEYPALSAQFQQSRNRVATLENVDTSATQFSNVFDYDILDYRKVIDVIDFEEGSTTGINTLFTIEQTLAQQTYFSYAMGNFGFDLVSWYTLKEFLDTREKMLATRKDLKFDNRTQYLQMYPQPGSSRFYGVIACYVERPIRDVIKEQWVYQYALALTKIVVGRVRSKFTGTQLLGGGTLNYDLLQEGLEEKQALETQLLEGASPGLGDAPPIDFFVG